MDRTTAAALETARQLTAQLARIHTLHRHGVEPTFMQHQDLFETSTQLQQLLALAPAGLAGGRPTCAALDCTAPATVSTVQGLRHCELCARQLQRLLGPSSVPSQAPRVVVPIETRG